MVAYGYEQQGHPLKSSGQSRLWFGGITCGGQGDPFNLALPRIYIEVFHTKNLYRGVEAVAPPSCYP